MIERAPRSLPDMPRRREEAKRRIAEWLGKGETPDEIISEGYKWRQWTREQRGDYAAWNWAVWEQIQLLAQEHGYEYKDELTEEDIFNDPFLPDPTFILSDEALRERYSRADYWADEKITNYRNYNEPRALATFLHSDLGRLWQRTSLRDLWRRVARNGGRAEKGGWGGGTRHFEELEPYSGMQRLRWARTWEEALAVEVTVYRGMSRGGENPRRKPVLSYTTSPDLARLFAEGYLHSYNKPGQGTVFKRTVKFGDLLGFYDADQELEVFLPPRRNSNGK